MKNYIVVNKSWAGHTLLGFTIAAALSISIIAIALKYYMTIKTIFWQQQAIISRLQQKEIVYSFLQRDLNGNRGTVRAILATPLEVHKQASGKMPDQMLNKIVAKITRQQIKFGSTILLVPDAVYYLVKDSKGYSLFRDDLTNAAVAIADGIENFTVQTVEHTDQAGKKAVVLTFTVEYVSKSDKDINTTQQFKLVAANA